MNQRTILGISSELPKRDLNTLLEQLAELKQSSPVNPWTPIVASPRRKRAQRRR